ncbi:HOL1 [Fusarium albosuccineum]|uniref:HOL1 n=1 Tax=Fusarium albosuccineum TaxID=1237068 RepID=A0A8H4LL32_9HYPO|nr:HOL1 [Fusarium albosuccineum]
MPSLREAFALSAQEVDAATPPGTVQIHREQEFADSYADFIQQSSNDPRDPLNFPAWRKLTALIVAALLSDLALHVPKDPRSYSELTTLIAVHILFLGAANIWWVPFSNWLGRRPVLLVATLLMTMSTLWCGLATSYNSLLAARVFRGIGGAAADSVAPALVGDLYPVHQRGRAMALYTIMLCAGPLAGGISGGCIAFRHGWKTIFWVCLALSGLCFIGTALFVPETLYHRQTLSDSTPTAKSEKQAEASQAREEEYVEDKRSARATRQQSVQSFSFVQSLRFNRPRRSLVQQLVRPWRTLALPGTWVVMLHYAGLVGGIVTISTIGAQLVAMPPYLWGANAGLINVGALVGTVVGYLYTHFLADGRLINQADKKRHGVAEAEDRLPTLFFPLFIATCGFFVFGFCAESPGGNRWVGLEIGYGMLAFGLMQVPSVGFNYLIDSYHSLAADCFTMVTILRAIIAFAWSYFVADWIHDRGSVEAFGIFGMLMGLFSLLSIPLWVYGKRMRIATADKVLRVARIHLINVSGVTGGDGDIGGNDGSFQLFLLIWEGGFPALSLHHQPKSFSLLPPPQTNNTATMGNFHESSENIRLEDGHILHAECGDGEGGTNESTLDLDYYLGNNDGYFEWDGNNFSGSASNILLEINEDGYPILSARLNPIDGDPREANVNLAERIGNDSGTLVFGSFPT